MIQKFDTHTWVRMNAEFLAIYPYNTGLLGLVVGYGHNPRYCHSDDATPLVMVRWVGKTGTISYLREKILENVS